MLPYSEAFYFIDLFLLFKIVSLFASAHSAKPVNCYIKIFTAIPRAKPVNKENAVPKKIVYYFTEYHTVSIYKLALFELK
jgi:hypothetical protein